MRLHSDYPYWMIKEGIAHSYPTLREDLRTDVAVIGAGITGALVGHALCKAGLDVVLLDKRHVAHGSTSANTALIQYETDTPLFLLEQKFGKRMAVRSYELCSEALDELGRLCRKLGDVGFEKHPSLWYATYKKHVAEILEPEYAARQAAGFNVSLLNEAEIEEKFGFSAPGGILSRQGAQVNPYRLASHLFEKIIAMGGRIHESTTVDSVEPSAKQVVLGTSDGCTITAKYLVVAAGYESNAFLPIDVGTIYSSYAIISKPLAERVPWYQNALLWETHCPYLYIRTTPDGRIIIGGRDDLYESVAKRDAVLKRKSRELQADFNKLFPHIPFEMDFWWAGTFADTKDGLPYVGPCNHKRVLYALGYGGNGITFSAIAAALLHDRILGLKNPDQDIFKFDRWTTSSHSRGIHLPAQLALAAARPRPSDNHQRAR
jgi:glycine/D-amino acid oxidase-like deaminating enzyme